MTRDLPVDVTIDIRDSISPISLLMVENRLAAMNVGQVLEVLCGDVETRVDLIRIVKNSGHRCVETGEAADCFRIRIEKRRE